MNTPNYKESTVSGTKWTRVHAFQGKNQRGSMPTLVLHEEDVVALDGQEIVSAAGSLPIIFNPDNPLHVAVYESINAVYVEEREKRDAIRANTPAPVVADSQPLDGDGA